MTKKEITNIPASIHQKLLNLSKQNKRPFIEVLQYFAMERFLCRLSQSRYRDRFVLKGALVLQVWHQEQRRATKDIDLLGRVNNSLENLAAIFQEIVSIDLKEDGITFDKESVTTKEIKKDSEYLGVRITFQGKLGDIRLHLQVDCGFGDAANPTEMVYPVLLDLTEPKLLCYRLETVIAEKYQAMITLDLVNTRLKDFYDIWWLSNNNDFDGAKLLAVISSTFNQRSTAIAQEMPTALTDEFINNPQKQSQWIAFLKKSKLDNGIEWKDVILRLREFLLPLTKAGKLQEIFPMVWRSKSGWQHKDN